jgi:putative tricarboxylic transport membrane protein
MNVKKYGNLIAGGLFLLFDIVYFLQIGNIKRSTFSVIDSAFFPIVLAVVLAVLSIALLAEGVRKVRSTGKTDSAAEQKDGDKDYACVLETFALSVVYVLLFQPLGFVLSSIIYLFFQIIVLSPKSQIRPVKIFVVSVVASVVVYVIFRDGLTLMLPNGILSSIF